MTHRLRPLTDRILAALPGPRWAWIAAWALVPWLNAGANLLLETESRSAVWEQGTALLILNYAALSLAIVLTLWGTARIAGRVDELAGDSRERFRELNSVVGPVAAATATAVAFAVSTFVSDGWTSAILRGATWFLLGIALWTFLWTYAVLPLGLDRLGRERLRPDVARVDPTLGVRPLGGIAFMGLWLLLAWLVPVLLTGLPDVVGVVIGLVVLGGALATFFLSLLRVHRRMVEVKASELALARELYAQAYEPFRSEPTLEALDRQAGLLGAADSLEKRARDLHEWPIGEGMLATVITIATSVVAVTIARLIVKPLGL